MRVLCFKQSDKSDMCEVSEWIGQGGVEKQRKKNERQKKFNKLNIKTIQIFG